MRLRVVAIAIALLASTASVAHAAGFVVAELFTSQGCSSCPPADALLGVMAKDPNIIALGCHVTYWDHESWKDTLAQPFCTARQYAYAKTVKDGVFTPQLIVDGIKSVVGNEPASVLLALHSAPPLPVITATAAGGTISVAMPDAAGIWNANVLLIKYGDVQTQAIGGGENSGHTVSYNNPVLSLATIGDWNGMEKTLTAPATSGHYAILAQGADGHIVGAGRLDIP